jgi:acyl transferase domain-containing protein/acyl carrier protein
MKTTDLIDNSGAVAVIGMAGSFPGARNIDQFWRNLRDGVEAVSFFSDRDLEEAGVGPEVYNDPAYVRAKGALGEVDMFDAWFFGITPAEAAIMDPQQRLFLECSWEALENAGYDFAEESGRIGVFAGSAMSTYLLFNLLSNPDLLETVSGLQVRITNDKDFLTTLVSYKLNLKGPSVAVQTACSTSLVAVHLACQGLLDGECDLALAGGVAVSFPHKSGYMYTEGGISSPDGHCRAFDAAAQGTIEGNGVGVVVLKRYEDAVVDGDFIHAVIKGSAINNDGSLKAGYTAPSLESQTQVVLEALEMAGVSADSVTYVEAHGSATPVGDPIEVQSLTKAFRAGTNNKGFCALGSVKTNIGHLDNAAGIASLIKTIEALKRRVIPPTLHFHEPNPRMDLSNSPFFVNTSPIEWRPGTNRRRAGVSSFGIGGTNAHLVVEEAPDTLPHENSGSRPYQLLLLSARTESALDAATANLAAHLRQYPALNLADVSHTLQVGRRPFDHRRMLLCRNTADAASQLESGDAQQVLSGPGVASSPEIVMMFPGLGDHHVEMALDLYREERAFRECVDYCAGILKPLLDVDLREVLYPSGMGASGSKNVGSPLVRRGPDLRRMLALEEPADGAAANPLNHTFIAQPAVFVVEYALARLLLEWGIRPHAMIGYSIGEYVAACLAGVFSLDDALFLVATRARMIDEIPGGAMLAVPLSEDELSRLLLPDLSICASNGPLLTVVGGPPEAVALFEQRLTKQAVAFKRLKTSHAFHSQMMDPIVEPFRKEAGRIRLNPPQISFISNVTGTWITAAQATDPDYWARHLRNTVRFADGLRELFSKPRRALLEVGPGQALSTLARQDSHRHAGQVVLSSMRDRRDECSDDAFLLATLGRLWLGGANVNWQGFYAHEHRRRVPLPTYPFERQRYWIEPGRNRFESPRPSTPVRKKADLAGWFYVPVWKRSRSDYTSLNGDPPAHDTCWLIFVDEGGLGLNLARRLTEQGRRVTCVRTGEHFKADGDAGFTINSSRREDYDALIRALRQHELLPSHVVHMWSLTPGMAPALELQMFDVLQERGFYSLVFLAQAFGELDVSMPIQIGVVSNHLYEVIGGEQYCASKATISGPCKVIPQEFPNITCRSIDVVYSRPDYANPSEEADSRMCESVEAGLIDQVIAELLSQSPDQTIAFRGRHRWVRAFEATRLTPRAGESRALKDRGKYLITGADQEIGLLVAEHLARSRAAKVALIAPSDFPARDKWEIWLSAHDDQDEVSRKIRRVRSLEMEVPETELMFITADVAALSQMQAALAVTLERFGELNGVIHAANTSGPGIIQLKTRETASGVLAPKTKGTLVLASLIRDLPLDFFALFSSTVSIAGGVGQVDSCAANAFLDAFANQRTLEEDRFTTSINWSAFQWDQWQVPSALGAPGLEEQLRKNLEENGISSLESLQVFERIIGDTLTQVIVCPQDLHEVINQADSFTVTSFLEAMEESRPTDGHPRPALAVSYVAPQNEIEQKIAVIWQEAFGIAQVGVDDNFFELAGNSLLAIQIVTRLRRTFEVEVSMTSLFDAPTVSELARKIQEIQLRQSELSRIERLLSEIEVLSSDEAKRKVAEEQSASE